MLSFSRLRATFILMFSILTLPLTVVAEEALRENLRASIFESATQALGQANDARASVLAPETYRSASEQFRKAQDAFEDGAELTKVRAQLATATGLFVQAQNSAASVGEIVKDAFEAREDAFSADAKTRAAELWQDAEVELYEATSRAEQGKTRGVERYSNKAQELFREAELTAIEVALFTEIETAVAHAKRLDADDWAPRSYKFAVDLLSQARAELAANRYDTDRPRNLANQSLHYARHAAYVAQLADDIDDNDTSLETVLMDWEAEIARYAAALDLPVYFDNGPRAAIDQFITQQQAQNRRMADTEQALENNRNRAQILEEELNRVQADLEGQERAKERLNLRLAAQQLKESKLKQVETMFEASEALVLRSDNQLILRLIGLGFSSGSARIEPHHYALLRKLELALEIFPEVPVTIEGHTDSYGVDSKNYDLSVSRAEAVVNYLLQNTAMQSDSVSAVGYGETKPIANNETDEGRKSNRRIDVVIYP